MNRSPLGKVMGEMAPLATCFEKIEQAAKHLIKINRARFGLFAARLQKISNRLKLLTGNIAWVRLTHKLDHP
jgi:hypothetical protein